MLTVEEHVKYWLDSADNDMHAAENLFKAGNYDWCLFIGHLILEKVLKAHYVKVIKETPPKIHNLSRLAEVIGLELNHEQKVFLRFVNSFNIEGRYPEIKQELYKIATKEYTNKNFNKIKEIYLWLKSQIM